MERDKNGEDHTIEHVMEYPLEEFMYILSIISCEMQYNFITTNNIPFDARSPVSALYIVQTITEYSGKEQASVHPLGDPFPLAFDSGRKDIFHQTCFFFAWLLEFSQIFISINKVYDSGYY